MTQKEELSRVIRQYKDAVKRQNKTRAEAKKALKA